MWFFSKHVATSRFPPGELVSRKTSNTVTTDPWKLFVAPTETSTATIQVLFSWVSAESVKVLIPYKALRIQRSSQLEGFKTSLQLPWDGDGCCGPRVLGEPARGHARHHCGRGTLGSPLIQPWLSVWQQLGNLRPLTARCGEWVPHICSIPDSFFSTSSYFRISEEFLTFYATRGCRA